MFLFLVIYNMTRPLVLHYIAPYKHVMKFGEIPKQLTAKYLGKKKNVI